MDCRKKYPLASRIIYDDFYVDDLISGGDILETAMESKNELIKALNGGGLSLRKWTSNSPTLLNSLPEEMTEQSLQSFSEDEMNKALGIQWNPKTDQFSFKINWTHSKATMSKRTFLSEASRFLTPWDGSHQ